MKKLCFLFLFFALISRVFAYDILKKSDVNAFDRHFMADYSKPLDAAGTAFTALSMGMPLVLLAAPAKDYWKIGVQYLETTAFSFGICALVKHCVDRSRPYMYFSGAPRKEIKSGDYKASFYSRHTTLSFSSAGFATFLFCEYFPDSKWKIPVIASSYAFAVGTGIFRMASGNHFLSDVLVGAAIGSACGYLIPLLNTLWFKPSNSNVALIVSPAEIGVAMRL